MYIRIHIFKYLGLTVSLDLPQLPSRFLYPFLFWSPILEQTRGISNSAHLKFSSGFAFLNRLSPKWSDIDYYDKMTRDSNEKHWSLSVSLPCPHIAYSIQLCLPPKLWLPLWALSLGVSLCCLGFSSIFPCLSRFLFVVLLSHHITSLLQTVQ